MQSLHEVIFQDAKQMTSLPEEAIDLVVTSPPYPMIQMWDQLFAEQNSKIGQALQKKDGPLAFELMHQELDKVWCEVFRVLKDGGIACINIGDATRTVNGRFALYTNHSRIQTYMQKLGLTALPAILWRKQTNAPNKFMGSGMMPPGAHVTLEHEYILILRKGNKKEFKTDAEKKLRRESSFFWEERNLWFSDVWMDLKGTSQRLFENKARERSAAFPFELPYRLITMFSVKNDTILDPFLGIGSTMYAAMATGRNSVGYEIDHHLAEFIWSHYNRIVSFSNSRINERLKKHLAIVHERCQQKGKFKYVNKHYRFPVMTRQETDLVINELLSIKRTEENIFEVTYSDTPQTDYVGFWSGYVVSDSAGKQHQGPATGKRPKKNYQQKQLFTLD